MGAKLGQIATSFTCAVEELGLLEVVSAVFRAVQGVRVADAQVSALGNRESCPQNNLALLREALGKIGAAGVLHQGRLRINTDAGRQSNWYFVAIDLGNSDSS